MDLVLTALAFSIVSAMLACFALGWNIYRDVLLKPRLRVRCQIAETIGAVTLHLKFISISAVNHGLGRVICTTIRLRLVSVWRRLRRRVKYAQVLVANTNALSGTLPANTGRG